MQVADDGDNCINLGCVVQDRHTGRIFVFGGIIPAGHESMEFRYLSPGMQEYQRKQGRENRPAIKPGYQGPDICRMFFIWSDDDGRTWSPIQDITRWAKHEPPALWAMPGPGVAIQLRHGTHAGRIVVPCYQLWLRKEGQRAWYQHSPLAVYSDDSGRTWQRGQLARFGGKEPRGEVSSETQMVELDDGRIGCILEGSEKGWCILFARFSLEWLTNNQDRTELQ